MRTTPNNNCSPFRNAPCCFRKYLNTFKSRRLQNEGDKCPPTTQLRLRSTNQLFNFCNFWHKCAAADDVARSATRGSGARRPVAGESDDGAPRPMEATWASRKQASREPGTCTSVTRGCTALSTATQTSSDLGSVGETNPYRQQIWAPCAGLKV